MNIFHEISMFTYQLQLLQEEYQTAPASIKYCISQDIQLLEDALALLQTSAG